MGYLGHTPYMAYTPYMAFMPYMAYMAWPETCPLGCPKRERLKGI